MIQRRRKSGSKCMRFRRVRPACVSNSIWPVSRLLFPSQDQYLCVKASSANGIFWQPAQWVSHQFCFKFANNTFLLKSTVKILERDHFQIANSCTPTANPCGMAGYDHTAQSVSCKLPSLMLSCVSLWQHKNTQTYLCIFMFATTSKDALLLVKRKETFVLI